MQSEDTISPQNLEMQFQSAYIRIEEETFVVQHCVCKLHHLCQYENVLDAMSDFFGNDLHKIRYELMQARVAANTGESCDAIIVVCLI